MARRAFDYRKSQVTKGDGMRLVLALSALLIASNAIADGIRIAIDSTPENPPLISGTTNLPDGAEFQAFLRGDLPACLPTCGFDATATVSSECFHVGPYLRDDLTKLPLDDYTVDLITGVKPPFVGARKPDGSFDDVIKFTARLSVTRNSVRLVFGSARIMPLHGDAQYLADEVKHGHAP
jgi:hypothetical protein